MPPAVDVPFADKKTEAELNRVLENLKLPIVKGSKYPASGKKHVMKIPYVRK